MTSEPENIGASTEEGPALETSGGETEPKLEFMYVHHLPAEHTHGTSTFFPVYLFQLKAPLAGNELEQPVKAAIDAIVAGTVHQVEPKHARVRWRLASFAVFVLQSSATKITGVKFGELGAPDHPGFKREGHLGKYKGCSAVWYRNRRKKKDDTDLGASEEVVRWIAQHPGTKAVPPGFFGHDSSTTNTGP